MPALALRPYGGPTERKGNAAKRRELLATGGLWTRTDDERGWRRADGLVVLRRMRIVDHGWRWVVYDRTRGAFQPGPGHVPLAGAKRAAARIVPRRVG